MSEVVWLARKVYTINSLTYTPVEYIQTTGTQFFATEFLPNNNTRVECKFKPTNPTSSWQFLFSGRNGSNNNDYAIAFQSSKWYFGFGNTNTQPTSPAISSSTDYTVDMNKNVTTINGTSRTITNSTFQSTKPLFILSSETGTNAGYAVLYYFKIYDNGTLAKNFIPVVDSNGIGCLYDTISEQAYYNQGTGSVTIGQETGEPALSGLGVALVKKMYIGKAHTITPVEYIESSGTQHIDTGITPNENIKCVVDFQLSSIPVANQVVIGSWRSNSGMLFGVRNVSTSEQNFQAAFGTSAWAGNSLTADTSRHTLYMNDENGNVRLDNTVLAYGSNAVSLYDKYSLRLFTSNDNGVVTTYYAYCKMYSCQIYNGNDLVRDFIPVLVDNTSYALYDQVNGKVYYNLGYGDFTGGNTTGSSTTIEKAHIITRVYAGDENDTARLTYGYEPVPNGAVHIFHFDNEKYDALGNYADTSFVPQQVSISNWGTHPYFNGCAKGTFSLQTAYVKAHTQTEILKNANVEFTWAFWGYNKFEAHYGHSSQSARRITITVTTTQFKMYITSGSGSYYSGRESVGATLTRTAAISITTNSWHHYAICVDRSKMMYVFLDGTLLMSFSVANGDNDRAWDGTSGEKVLSLTSSSAYWDELILAHTCLWKSDFTPPPVPYDT